MAWKTVNGKRYFYRQRRVGDDVVSEFVGGGLIGELAEALDERERMQRRSKAEQHRREAERQNEIERQVNEVDDAVRALVHGVLLASGHKTHKRQWKVKT